MNIEIRNIKEPLHKHGPFYGLDDVIKIYKEGLIDKYEARFMLGCITKHSWLMERMTLGEERYETRDGN